MAFIHGGGFLTGSGAPDFYGPEFLLDKDVVVLYLTRIKRVKECLTLCFHYLMAKDPGNDELQTGTLWLPGHGR